MYYSLNGIKNKKIEKIIANNDYDLILERNLHRMKKKKLPGIVYDRGLFKGMPIDECMRLVCKLKTFGQVNLTIQFLEKHHDNEKGRNLIKMIKEHEKYRIRFILKD